MSKSSKNKEKLMAAAKKDLTKKLRETHPMFDITTNTTFNTTTDSYFSTVTVKILDSVTEKETELVKTLARVNRSVTATSNGEIQTDAEDSALDRALGFLGL